MMDEAARQRWQWEQQTFHGALAGVDLAEPNPNPKGVLPVYEGGSHNADDVKTIQKKLKALGYLSVVTGTYSSTTTVAVRNFQNAYGLPVTGQVDGTTWDLLMKKGTGAGVTTGFNFVTDLITGLTTTPDIAAAASGETTGGETPKPESMSPLLIGGVVVGALFLVGGIFFVATRN